MKKKKFVIWGLAACLVIQVVIAGIAMAASPSTNDLTGHSEYLVVHGTTDPSHLFDELGGTSKVTVKKPDNTVMTSAGGVYTDIPNGSKLEMEYAFNLVDGDGHEPYDYTNANYFDIKLPVDITLSGTIGEGHNVYADPGPSQWLLGSWALFDTHTIRFSFSNNIPGHFSVWGKFGFNGTFDNINYGDVEERTIMIGADNIVFRRTPPTPPQISLQKTGAYNAAENTIEWTVTMTPPAGWALDGYTLVDTYSPNQSYVPESFAIGAVPVADASLDLTADHQVSYTFPDTDPNTTGVQTIKYKTRPDSFGSEDGTASGKQCDFKNTATMKHGTDTLPLTAEATVTTNWITKTAPNDSDPNVIRWDVTVNVPNNGSVTGAYILDTLPLGMILDTGHPVQISLNGGTLTTVESTSSDEWGKYAYTPGTFGSSGTSGTLIYRFPSSGTLNRTARLVYYTKVGDPDYYVNNNGTVNFRNTAQLEWTQKPTSTDPPKDYVDGNIPGSGLIGKVALNPTPDNPERYNQDNHGYIHWQITVNRNKVTMNAASVADVIPAGQKLVIDSGSHPFIVSVNGVAGPTYTDIPSSGPLAVTDNNNFTYTFPASFADTYTLDYYTQIIDVSAAKNETSGLDTLYSNGDGSHQVYFGNRVTLQRSGYADIINTPNKTFNSQMISKGVGTYDYTDHTVKWTISVNRNRMPLTNAYVTELLPTGMDLLVDTTHPFELYENGVLKTSVHAPTTVAGDGRSFVMNLGEKDVETTIPYTITFFTHLQDAQLETQWSGNKTYINNAQLRSDNYNGTIDASASIGITNPVISKSRTYTAGSDSIDWSIAINAGKIPLLDAVVTDQLDSGLQLQPASLKLYEVEVDPSTGNVRAASTGTLVTTGYTVDLPSTGNSNTLSVDLPNNSTKAYRLEFTTFIVSDDLNFTNNAVLSGKTDSPDGDADAQNVSVSNLWSSGGSGSRTLTVYKDDGKGNPVPGSIYQLFNFNQQPILKSGNPVTATTDSHGNAVFTNLPAWVFYAKEIYAPDGFLLNPDMFGGERLSTDKTFTTADASALGTVSFNKVNHKGAALSGGEFTLTGKAHDDTDVSMTASSVNGVVTFINLPIGTYTIRETRAPAGYYLSDVELTATVEYADPDRLAVQSVLSANRIVDQPITSEHFGSIRLMKTDETNKPLAGAEFGLYNSDGALVQRVVSQSNGVVTFSHVTLGTYKIREITPPLGYVASTREITATIEDDDDVIDGGTFINDTIYGGIRLLKTSEDGVTPLPGAQFSLYKKGETKILAQAVSGTDGSVVFGHLLYGDYVIRETKAPAGYVLSSKETAVSIKEDDVTVEAGSFVNARNTGSPDTGDNILVYFVMALGSLAGIAVVYVINKRIKKVR